MNKTDIEQLECAVLDILDNHKTDSQYLSLVKHFLTQACQLETTDFALVLRVLKLTNRFEAYIEALVNADRTNVTELLVSPQLHNGTTQTLLTQLAAQKGCSMPIQAASAPTTPPVGYRVSFIGSPTTRYLLTLLRQRTIG